MPSGLYLAPQAAAGRAAAEVAAWPPADLERRVLRAVEFASVAVKDFGEQGYADPVRPALGFDPEKVSAEAAMLAYVAHSAQGSARLREAVDALARQIEPLVRSRRALADMARNPDRVFRRVVPHVLLTAMGRRDDAFDDVAARLSARVLAHAVDQPATVIAERRWIAGVWGRVSEVPDLPAGTVLTHPFDLLAGSREDAYGLTHLLFYVTDFGRSSTLGAARPHRAITADVEGLVLRYLDQGDYDLVGELLMAWPQLRQPWSPTSSFAFRVLAQVEDAVGVLPCGNVDPRRLAELEGAERTRYARATSYHTALVMGFLCSLALRDGSAPPTSVIATEFPEDSWRTFRGMLGGHAGDWLPVFDGCAGQEKRALAPALLGLVIAQALRRNDYQGLVAALEASQSLGMPDQPLATAATDLLRALGAAARIGIVVRG